MKSTFKSFFVILLVCSLTLSMTGCDKLDYRKAIKLYNAGSYEVAADMFYGLEDYEDSKELYTSCQYWIAANLAQQGHYEEALPRFLKLGEYENSAQWVTECKYQLALAAFGEEHFADAQALFLEIPDYQQAKEYLRQISWQTMFDSICALDEAMHAEQNGKSFHIFAPLDDQDSPRLVFSVEMAEQEDYLYSDFLTITLTRDSTVADFTCGSDFQMEYVDSTIGSSQSGSGRIDITTCTPETVLVLDTFEKAVTDNLGNTTTSADPADSLMTEMLSENLSELLTVIPQLLSDASITLTLNDIGFSAL